MAIRPVPESHSLDERELKARCGEGVAKYKKLTGGVEFVNAIPKNPSGEILKRVLREVAKKELERDTVRL